MPLAFGLILSAYALQHFLNKKPRNPWIVLAILGGIVVLVNDIWQHLKLWRVVNMGIMFPPTPLDLNQFFVQNRPDPLYYLMVICGVIIFIITTIFLGVMVYREWHRSRRNITDPPNLESGQ